MDYEQKTRSEIDEYVKAVTAPTTGEEWLIALRDPNSPVSKLLNDIEFYDAVTVYELMELVIIHNLETRKEAQLARAEELRKVIVDARKEQAAARASIKERPTPKYEGSSKQLDAQIESLQEAINVQEQKIEVLETRIVERQEKVNEYTKEWHQMHEERREKFVDSLKDHYQNNILVDKKGNPVLDENGQPKRAVILDADGKEITFDPETDKERIDAVNKALDGKPTPEEVHKFTEGKVTAEQCAKNGAVNRGFKVMMAKHRLNPKDEDASSLKDNDDKEKSIHEVQAKIDAIREKGELVEKKRELMNKIDKAETEEEKKALRQELKKLREGDNFSELKSNLVAAINRDKGIDPENPGVKCKAAPTYENFDGGRLGLKAKEGETPTFYQQSEDNIAGTFEELDAKKVLENEKKTESAKLNDMQSDLKTMQAQQQQQAPSADNKSGL